MDTKEEAVGSDINLTKRSQYFQKTGCPRVCHRPDRHYTSWVQKYEGTRWLKKLSRNECDVKVLNHPGYLGSAVL